MDSKVLDWSGLGCFRVTVLLSGTISYWNLWYFVIHTFKNTWGFRFVLDLQLSTKRPHGKPGTTTRKISLSWFQFAPPTGVKKVGRVDAAFADTISGALQQLMVDQMHQVQLLYPLCPWVCWFPSAGAAVVSIVSVGVVVSAAQVQPLCPLCPWVWWFLQRRCTCCVHCARGGGGFCSAGAAVVSIVPVGVVVSA